MEGTALEIFEQHQDKQVLYKGKVSGYIAGWQDHYVIIGFRDFTGCIQRFSVNVICNEARCKDGERFDFFYHSYRFAKPKNIELYKQE